MADDMTAAERMPEPTQAAGTGDGSLLVPNGTGSLSIIQLVQAEGANSLLAVGNVTVLEGTARATHSNNVVVDLTLGDPVFEGDIVETGPDTSLAITFIDNSIVTLSENARIVIEVLIYDPADKDNLLTMTMLQGSILLFSGEIAETGKMLAKTPVGLLDITGTGVFTGIGPPGEATTIVLVQDGLFRLIGIQDTTVFDLLGEAIRALQDGQEHETFIADLEQLAEDNPGLFAAAQLALSLVRQNSNQPSGEGLEESIVPEAGSEDQGDAGQNPPVLGPQRTPGLDPSTFDPLGTSGRAPEDQQSQPIPGPPSNDSAAPGGADSADSSTALRLLGVLQRLAAFFPDPEGSAPPDAEGDAANIALANAATTQEDAGATTFNLFTGGAGTGGVTVSAVTNGSNGTVQILDAAAGIVAYTQNPGDFDFLGPGSTAGDSFTYSLTDSSGASVTQTFRVAVEGVNDAPTAAPATGTAQEDGAPAAIDLAANIADPDQGDVLTITAGPGSNGGTTAVSGTVVTFSPAPGFYDFLGQGQTAQETFTYSASDRQGAVASALATVTIVGTNDAPVANPDLGSITELMVSDDLTANFVTGNLLANDTDPESDPLTVSAISGGGAPGGTASTGAFGSLTIAGGGGYTYELDDANTAVDALDDGETLIDVFTYTAFDGDKSDTATLGITINGANDAPLANDDADSLTELMVSDDLTANNVTGNVLVNDPDLDIEPLTVSAVSGGGTPGGTASAGAFGSLTIAAGGGYTYELDDANTAVDALGDGETLIDSFTYTAFDGDKSDTATLSITISGANDAPLANDDADSLTELRVSEDTIDNIVTGDVLANDSDPESDPLTVSAISGGGTPDGAASAGAFGSLTIAAGGGYTYELNDANSAVDALGDGETLTDSFTYSISDGNGGVDTAKVTIVVKGVDDPLRVEPPKTVSLPDDPATLDLQIQKPIDPEGDTLTVAVTELPRNGTIAFTRDGKVQKLQIEKITADELTSLTFDPAPLAKGGAPTSQPLTYTVEDESGGAVKTIVTLNVNQGGEDAPDVKLEGSSGNDILIGGTGDDALIGLGGADLLNGGNGRNQLTGGPGPDFFEVAEDVKIPSGQLKPFDLITDFAPGIDVVGVLGLAQDRVRFGEDGLGNATISVDTGEMLAVLQGVRFSELQPGDVVFV